MGFNLRERDTIMKRLPIVLFALAFFAIGVSVQAASFTPGNLVVLRLSDGVTPISTNGTPGFLDEYTTAGALVQSIALPTTQSGANYPIAFNGTATSEGLMNLSADGKYLVIAGYATNTVAPASGAVHTAPGVPRVVARVDASGNIDTSTVLGDLGASPGNCRSAASTDGLDLWFGNSSAAIRYTTLGATSTTQLSTNPVNIRALNITANQLYASSQSGAFRIYTVGTGLPTTSGQTCANLSGILTNNSNSPYQFIFVTLQTGASSPDTMYVADDASTAGIVKYSLVAGNWTSNGTIRAASVRGLTASVEVLGSTTNVHLFATGGSSASNNAIVAYTDSTGYNASPGSVYVTTNATATGVSVFRGIAFAPTSAAPTNVLRITSIKRTGTGGNDMDIHWTVLGGLTYVLQANKPPGGSYDTNFTDLATITAAGSGLGETNYVHVGGGTNRPSLFYKVKELHP
jgi:hypothetical protein